MVKDCLHELARLYGVQTAYDGVDGRRRPASRESVSAVLKAMGAPIHGAKDAADALRWKRQSHWQTMTDPVAVAWQGQETAVEARIPESLAGGAARCLLEIEGGPRRTYQVRGRSLRSRPRRVVEGARYVVHRIPLPKDLPPGYHRLTLTLAGREATTRVIAAPAKAFHGEGPLARAWGAFLPLHALHRRTSWGAGDLGDLRALVEWVAQQGGRAVQVLPLLSELRELGDGPTPYAPATRLFWDEFYLDVTRLPHLAQCRAAREILVQAGTRRRIAALRRAPLVDYAAQMRLKRRVLEALAKWYFAQADRAGLAAFLRRCPPAEAYARFRAVGEGRGAHWDRWPQPLRDGRIGGGDYDERLCRYYLYVLWQTQEQFAGLAKQARSRGVRLCLDLPVGVRRDGFDTWHERGLFVHGVGVGAPPDDFFASGQNWGLVPADPRRQREDCYRYWRACLRRQLECAGILRVDHVMGLHRLWWVPEGMPAADGVYVRYPTEEMFAVLALESWRHKALIVGENLGTVPPAVNRTMRRRGILSMYVLPFEVSPARSRPVRRPSAACLACLNTHDMPTFAALWPGLDIDERLRLGLLTAGQARQERKKRQGFREAVLAQLRRSGFPLATNSPAHVILAACLEWLGAGEAAVVMVNLEDLWGETRPQNLPGVGGRQPNWRRRARLGLEEFACSSEVIRALAALDRSRRRQGRTERPSQAQARRRPA
jgi:4-alpha-glucanotransferase